mgnify:CR=1 FL=1
MKFPLCAAEEYKPRPIADACTDASSCVNVSFLQVRDEGQQRAAVHNRHGQLILPGKLQHSLGIHTIGRGDIGGYSLTLGEK